MAVRREQITKIKSIIDDLDEENPGPDPVVLTLKLVALQTQLMSEIVDELGGIERCLQQISGRM